MFPAIHQNEKTPGFELPIGICSRPCTWRVGFARNAESLGPCMRLRAEKGSKQGQAQPNRGGAGSSVATHLAHREEGGGSLGQTVTPYNRLLHQRGGHRRRPPPRKLCTKGNQTCRGGGSSGHHKSNSCMYMRRSGRRSESLEEESWDLLAAMHTESWSRREGRIARAMHMTPGSQDA